MKKLIIVFIFILIPCLAGAGILEVIARTRVVGGEASCDNVLYDETGGAIAGDTDINDNSTLFYLGHTYNEGTARAICSVSAVLSYKAGDITGKSFHAALFSKSGNDLNVELATSDPISGNNSWSTTTVDFPFSTPYELASSTDYAIVIYVDAATDAVNFAEFEFSATKTITGEWTIWGNDKTRTTNNSSQSFLIKVKYQ